MAVTIQTNGAQAATIGATHTLATATSLGVWQFVCSVTALSQGAGSATAGASATGDYGIIELWGKVLSSSTARLIASRLLGAGVTPEKIFHSWPVMLPWFQVKLRQPKQTSRTWPWAVYKLGTPVLATANAQAATIGATHTLMTVTTNGVYQFVCSVTALRNATVGGAGATGDRVAFDFYHKPYVSATRRLLFTRTIGQGAQSERVFISVPVSSPVELRINLRQEKVTARTFGWALYRVA